MNEPLVSILMPTFNVGELVLRAVESVKAQTYSHWELIIIDDCSTDTTLAVLEQIVDQDARISVIKRQSNGGPGAARNIGLDRAAGSWITMLDADDSWRPHRLERLVAMTFEAECDFVADNLILYDDSAELEVGPAAVFEEKITEMTALTLFRSEYVENPFPLSLVKPLISLSFINEGKVRYPTAIRFAEDMCFYSELLIKGARAFIVSEPMYVYTTPTGKISKQKSRGSRTNNTAAAKVWLADSLIERFEPRISEDLKREIGLYRRRALQRYRSQIFSQLRRSRNWPAVAHFAIRHPIAIIRYVWNSPSLRQARKQRH